MTCGPLRPHACVLLLTHSGHPPPLYSSLRNKELLAGDRVFVFPHPDGVLRNRLGQTVEACVVGRNRD